MFGNRKRKLQEGEESLVPHGLIWHATVEPTPEEVAKSEEALGYTLNYAQEIEHARRQQSEHPAEEGPASGSPAPSAKPVVTPWWRVEQPEAPLERPASKPAPMPLSAYVPTPIEPPVEPPRPSRIQPLEIRPVQLQPMEVRPEPVPPPPMHSTQPISAPIPIEPPSQILQTSMPQVQGSMAISTRVDLPPAPTVYKSRVPDPQSEERLVPESSEITEALALVFSRLRSAGKTAWLSVASVSGKAVQRGRQTVRSLELRERLAHAGRHSQTLIQGGVARSSRYARTTGSTLGAFSRTGISRVQQMSARVRAASSTSSGNVMRSANTQPSAPSRVRLALAASALRARIITAQQLSAWRLRRERMAVDSRFWASMTLSAIAAVIALVIVSVVPHYATRSLPSRILNTNPSVKASVAAPVAVSPAPVQKTATPLRKAAIATSTQTAATKPTSTSANSTKAAANPKPKHIVQDDYVAPNTYRYYGTGSKARAQR